MRVLIVEDDEPIAELIATALEGAGYSVQVAPDGAAALGALESAKPDALVVDINMPVMDGFSFLEAVRARKIDLPALMLTAQSSSEDIRRSMQLGASDFIGKPFEMRLFLRRFERMVQAASPA
jgi:DNA-binding response OmpR family regulator